MMEFLIFITLAVAGFMVLSLLLSLFIIDDPPKVARHHEQPVG